MASPVLELESLFVRIYADAAQLFTTSKRVQEEMDRLARRMQQAMAAFAGGAVYAFAKFDDALTRTMARMRDWEQESRSLFTGGVFDISTRSITSPVELAKGLDILTSAGMNAAMATKALAIAEEFSVASGMKMERATSKLVDIQAAYGLNMENTEDHYRMMTSLSDQFIGVSIEARSSVEDLTKAFGNRFVNAARELKIPFEEAIALQGAMSRSQVRGTAASDRGARLLNVLTDKTYSNVAAWQRFGVEIFNSSGKMNKLSDIIAGFDERLAHMEPAQAKATLMLMGFTDRNITAIQSVIGISKEMKRLEERTKELGGTTEMMAEMLRRSFGSQLQILWNNITALAIVIGSKLAPTLAWIATQIETLTNWFKALNPAVQNLVLGFIGLVTFVRPAIFILQMLGLALLLPFSSIVSSFKNLIQIFYLLVLLPGKVISSFITMATYLIAIPGRIIGSFAALAMFFITLPLRLLGFLVTLLTFITTIPGLVVSYILAPFRAIGLVLFSIQMAAIQVGMLVKTIFVGIYTAAVAVFVPLYAIMIWPFVTLWNVAGGIIAGIVRMIGLLTGAIVFFASGAVTAFMWMAKNILMILGFALLAPFAIMGAVFYALIATITLGFYGVATAVGYVYFALTHIMQGISFAITNLQRFGNLLLSVLGHVLMTLDLILDKIVEGIIASISFVFQMMLQGAALLLQFVVMLAMMIPIIVAIGSVVVTIGLGISQLFNKVKDSIGSVKTLAGNATQAIAEGANNAALAAVSMWDRVKETVASHFEDIVRFFSLLAGFFWNFRDNMSIIWAWLQINWREVAFDMGAAFATVLENLAHNIKETFLLIMRLGGIAIMFVFDQFKQFGWVIKEWFRMNWSNIGNDFKLVMSAVIQALYHNFMKLFKLLGAGASIVGRSLYESFERERIKITYSGKERREKLDMLDYVSGIRDKERMKEASDALKNLKGPGDFIDESKLQTYMTGSAGLFAHITDFFRTISISDSFKGMITDMKEQFTGRTASEAVPAVLKETPNVPGGWFPPKKTWYGTTVPMTEDESGKPISPKSEKGADDWVYRHAMPGQVAGPGLPAISGITKFLERLNPLLEGFKSKAPWDDLMKSLKLGLPDKDAFDKWFEGWTRFMKPGMDKGEEAGQQLGKQGPGFQFKQISLARTMLGGPGAEALDFQQLVTLKSIDKNVALIAGSRGGISFPKAPREPQAEPLIGP